MAFEFHLSSKFDLSLDNFTYPLLSFMGQRGKKEIQEKISQQQDELDRKNQNKLSIKWNNERGNNDKNKG